MSAAVVPPPPPPEVADQPPLPDEPPLPLEPPPPGMAQPDAYQAYVGAQAYAGVQGGTYGAAYAYPGQHQYPAQVSYPGTHVGGSAAYPYAQHPLYQYPLQQSYPPQSHTAYSPYAQYNQAAWSSAPGQQHYVYHPAQYQAHSQVAASQQYTTAAACQASTTTTTVQASAASETPAATGTPGIGSTAPISFSLNTTSLQQPASVAVGHVPASATKPVVKDDSTALKDWIRRGLAKYDKSNEAQIRDLMKGIIEDKKRQGIMYTHDWDREPIPALSPPVCRALSPSAASRVMRFQASSPHVPSPQLSKRTHAFTEPEEAQEEYAWVKKAKKKNKKRRREAFEPPSPVFVQPTTDAAWAPMPDVIITGTCQNLEKSFLRLNGAPKAEEVRPEPVLIRALNRIAAVIAGGEKDFMYIWSQLKAIRQDLTVQHIRTTTAVQCEELFARASLNHADQQEFRKCVSTLQSYYDEGLPGCRAEFGAYQLLLYVCVEQKNRGLSLSRAIPRLVHQGIRDTPEVVHAQQVLNAVAMSNYAKFWRLYATAPHCSRLVMDWGVEKARFDCIKMMTEAFKAVPLQSCMNLLGFAQPVLNDSTAEQVLPGCTSAICVGASSVAAEDETSQWQKCVLCIQQHKGVVLRKDSQYVFDAKSCVQKIVMPAPEQNTAKAVGNTHLNVSVFVKEKKSCL